MLGRRIIYKYSTCILGRNGLLDGRAKMGGVLSGEGCLVALECRHHVDFLISSCSFNSVREKGGKIATHNLRNGTPGKKPTLQNMRVD